MFTPIISGPHSSLPIANSKAAMSELSTPRLATATQPSLLSHHDAMEMGHKRKLVQGEIS